MSAILTVVYLCVLSVIYFNVVYFSRGVVYVINACLIKLLCNVFPGTWGCCRLLKRVIKGWVFGNPLKLNKTKPHSPIFALLC